MNEMHFDDSTLGYHMAFVGCCRRRPGSFVLPPTVTTTTVAAPAPSQGAPTSGVTAGEAVGRPLARDGHHDPRPVSGSPVAPGRGQSTARASEGEAETSAAEMTAGVDLTGPPPPGASRSVLSDPWAIVPASADAEGDRHPSSDQRSSEHQYPFPGTTGKAGMSRSTPPHIVGVDLSLSRTGIATDQRVHVITDLDLTRAATHRARCERIRRMMGGVVGCCALADVVVIEGPAFSKGADPGSHERAGLWWLTYNAIEFARPSYPHPAVVIVGPSQLKKYATGKGNAGKPQVVAEAIRRLGYTGHDDNEADALWLRAMALDFYGFPLCPMPAANRAALVKVDWPEVANRPDGAP